MLNYTIRGFNQADWETAAILFTLPQCQRGTLHLPYQSLDDIRERLESNTADHRRLAAVLTETGQVIGMIGLQQQPGRRAHVGYLGMAVHDDYQGQGVGSALMAAVIDLADNWLNLFRLELTVFVDNEPAVHLYQKHGFTIEGTLRAFAFRDGQYVDAYTMARLKQS